MSNLTPVIKSLQDVMRQDAGINGDAQRIEQMVWLLFLKVFDALEEELELTRDDYKSPIPEHLRWRQWAADPEGITGDALLDFVNNTLFPKLKALPADPVRNPRGWVVRGVFEDANNFMKSGQLLRQVINKLGAIDFNRQAERHQFNDLYEKILRDLQSAGNAGEFYTPRAVTQFMVDMVNPQLGEKVLDPATGTGGFLVCAIEHLRKQVKNTEQEALLQSSILGVEKKQLPHLLCVTNLLLHGIEVPSNVRHDNTLARPLRDYAPAERVDVVLTNPPFGGIEEPGIEAGFPADVRTKETADLFLVLIKHILKVNGRAALVLPDGTLFGEGVKTRIKEQLLAECNLHTIVRLPNGVFAPYTGIKTNLLFFTKGRTTDAIWYYEHPYPVGVKSYNKTKPIRIEEFDAEKAWWGSEADGFAARVENERAWKVDIATIRASGYNLDQKNPHTPDAVSHDPDELLRDYAKQQREAQGLRDQLKAILAESLGGSAGVSAVLAAREPSARYLESVQPPLVPQFELLATAPGGVARLRELILALAVQGKVVQQDSDDEPASELLRRIRSERAALVAAGSIKQGKPSAPISPEEEPCSLPRGWAWVRFGDLIHELCTGPFGSLIHKEDYVNGGVPLINPSHMIDGRIDHDPAVSVSASMASQLSAYRLSAGDVLLARRGEMGRYALVTEREARWLCGTGSFFLKLFKAYDRRFFGLTLEDPRLRRHLLGESVGSTMTNLNQRILLDVVVAVAPLAEQARIVARVDELMRLCDALEAKGRLEAEQHARLLGTLLGTLTDSSTPEELTANWQRVADHFDLLLDRPEAVDALEQTILQLAVRGLLVPQDSGEEPANLLLNQIHADRRRLLGSKIAKADKPSPPINEAELRFALPPGWSWARLSEISNVIVDCPHSTAKFVDTGLLCLDTNSFKDGKLLAHKLRFVSQETFDERIARLKPVPGDLVFAREGAVGQSIIIPEGIECCLGQRVMLFRLSQRVSNEFVRLAITTEDFLDALLSLHKGIGAKHVNVADMRNAVVPVPPFREQERILARITELRRLCADLRERLAASQTTQSHLAEALVAEVA